ncbi:MAG: SDR family NAD(P)-dependent oxidoreductase, partial [Candidatus Aenigmatarchaeota archaeon]
MKNTFKNKKILITGVVGSIGSEIVRNILKYNPKVVRIFDNNESGIFTLQQEFIDKNNIRFLIGDVRDKERLKRAIEDIDIVFHAAAMKHVPLCEYNPFESVKTNVLGTQNLIEASIDEEVEKVITISTDKVVSPTGTMGATKLLAEKLTIDANYYKGKRKTILSSVRFGNVMGSQGSVIPLFKEQIKKGGPVTITEPSMIRFMMSMNQAVDMILNAARIMQGGEIFIFKMPVMKLEDLTEIMIKELAPRYCHKVSKINIKHIGIRRGEKMFEDLMTENEARHALETTDMFIVLPETEIPHHKEKMRFYKGTKKIKSKDYISKNNR